jgi:hypothetical protein
MEYGIGLEGVMVKNSWFVWLWVLEHLGSYSVSPLSQVCRAATAAGTCEDI